MKKKIAIIGANGQLGTDLVKVFSEDPTVTLYSLTHQDIEVTNEKSIEKSLYELKPDFVVNTAAYNKVDEAENETEKAYILNALGPRNLSIYCAMNNITLVHLSTDYVFGLEENRETPYAEFDLPGPINAYGISKLAGEYFVRANCKKHYIIRTCGLYGKTSSSGKGYNFVDMMLKIANEKKEVKVVNDQVVSPTYTRELARQIHILVVLEKYGIYHATAQGSCTWYEFAKKIFEYTNTQVNVIPITSNELQTRAKRGKYTVLENHNLQENKQDIMKAWYEGLREYLKEKSYI